VVVERRRLALQLFSTYFLSSLFLLSSLLSVDEFNELICPFAVVNRELTVGKVYAALMIFDYYKQNRAKRLEQQLGLDFTGTIKVVYGHNIELERGLNFAIIASETAWAAPLRAISIHK
jgi:hypothetical protein